MVKKKTSSGKVKTCEVHDLLHDLILREVWKERSIYFTKSNVIVSPPMASFEHRIIFNFGVAPLTHIEHVYDKSSLPRASSFLCFERDGTPGSCSQVDSFITFTNFKWLTVLDMCFQPFDHLPSEIWELSQLRYLALSNFSVLPPSVCNLRHLQTLFCYSNHPSICLPAEIWVIKQLRHLYFRKCRYFPNVQSEQEDYLLKLSDYNLALTKLQTLPYYPGKFSRSNLALTNCQTLRNHLGELSCLVLSLTKLQSLSYITFGSITRGIFEGMPNLRKLGIRESEEERLTAKQISGKLKTLVLLEHLEALKCFFINPWLKDYAFQGSEWEPTDERFQQLKFLLLDGTDLIHWKASSFQFPKLEGLVWKNCYCLYEIPEDVAEIPTLQFIELYHCSSTADDSANRIQEEQHSIGNDDLVVRIHKFYNCELFMLSLNYLSCKDQLIPYCIYSFVLFVWQLNLKACIRLIFSTPSQQAMRLMQRF
ncbi:hypothetical protein T459_34966 [Capsicum annuum]|uniref:Disease resistance R13L4/SHOC-2-like LRR domain-containing protein n=1 Tax=Capsicum annuum TaxID=4072 RepID=A0A2G2XUP8_CAPAN|nr:hypothetical protein T459_34966 [Capsicum annuum]